MPGNAGNAETSIVEGKGKFVDGEVYSRDKVAHGEVLQLRRYAGNSVFNSNSS